MRTLIVLVLVFSCLVPLAQGSAVPVPDAALRHVGVCDWIHTPVVDCGVIDDCTPESCSLPAPVLPVLPSAPGLCEQSVQTPVVDCGVVDACTLQRCILPAEPTFPVEPTPPFRVSGAMAASILITWEPSYGAQANVYAAPLTCTIPKNDVYAGRVTVSCVPPNWGPSYEWYCQNPFVESAIVLAPGEYLATDWELAASNDCGGQLTQCAVTTSKETCIGTVDPNWGTQTAFDVMVCDVQISTVNQQNHVGWKVECFNDP